MKAWLAVAKKEARQVAPEVLVLSLLAGIVPLVVGLDAEAASSAEALPIVAAMACATAALVLGAGVLAGDPAPAFLAARAIGVLPSLSARVTSRLAGLAVVTTVAALAAGPGASRASSEIAAHPLALVPMLVLAFLCAAVASAFVRRPLTAVVPGAALAQLVILLVVGMSAVRFRDGGAALPVIATNLWRFALPLVTLALVLVALPRADTTRRPQGQLKKLLTGSIVAIVAAAALWLVAGNLVTGLLLDRARARWEAEMGAPPPFESAVTSPDGLAADAIARRLGTRLCPRPGESWRERPSMSRELTAALDDAVRDRGDHLQTVLDAYLDEHAADLAQLRSILVGGHVTWTAERRPEADIPDLLGHLQLTKLLGADAMRRARGGDAAGAREDMLAMRGLEMPLRRHPALICRIAAASLSRWRARVARLAALPAGTIAELDDSADLAGELRQAAASDLALGLDTIRREATHWLALPGARTGRARLAGWLYRPVVRYETARELDSEREPVARLQRAGTCEALALSQAPYAHSRGWLPLDDFMNSAAVVRRPALAEAEWELTRVVASVRDWRAAHPGEPVPASLLASRACLGHSWVLEPRPDGGFVLKAWPEVRTWPGESGFLHQERGP